MVAAGGLLVIRCIGAGSRLFRAFGGVGGGGGGSGMRLSFLVRGCGIHLILSIPQFDSRYVMFPLLQEPRLDEVAQLFLYALSTFV